MPIKFINPREKQNVLAVLQTILADGITDLATATEILERDIRADIAERMKDEGRLEKLDPELRRQRRERQKQLATARKERARTVQRVACPSCKNGRLILSCGGALHCTANCGYSVMRKR